ncbi:IclR family transcriptional regulator [Pararhodobacter sp. SW119]|uniref:IclR family transcriptional regulator n=1 Tax=Pararhodobacter sp. SW119 TaxID=2780075 RepID=UPI001ADECEAE|nr:IclR family transcriptional regulator [Pararhodobacter sp. SW119]
MPTTQGASVRTIDRAAAVLRALAAGPGAGMRLADVTAAVGLGKATVHRLLGALVEVGFIELDAHAKRYRLGFALYALGRTARRFRVVDLAGPALERLAEATGDTVYLSIRDGDEALCVDRRTGSYPIRTLTLDVGDRRPLGVGAGSLALLAHEPTAEAERIIAAAPEARRAYPQFDAPRLRRMIEETRATGFAFNDGRIVSAMCALGMPVIDAEGRVIAALSIAAIRERMAPARRDELVALLRAEAAGLAQALDPELEIPSQRQAG